MLLRSVKTLAFAAALVFVTACDQLPRDPRHTLERIRKTHEIVAGVAEDRPFIERRGEEAAGVEADIIRGFASSLGATVKWKWGAQEKHFHDLEQFQLDLVAGGVTAKSPWSKKVAMTRPYAETLDKEKHTIAAPPGENALLLEFEKFLAEHHGEFAMKAGDAK